MKSAANGTVTVAAFDAGTDPLDEFGSEVPETPPARTGLPAGAPQQPRPRNWLVWALAFAALVQAPIVVLWLTNTPPAFARGAGTVHVESSPPGAQVRMEDRALGMTPLVLALDPGERVLEVQYGTVVRQLPMQVGAGDVIRQHIEFIGAAPAAPAVASGALSVSTVPARSASVTIDGTPRGTSPVVVTDLAPGDHAVVVQFPTGTVERTIRVESGATASFVATMPPSAAAVSGWVAVKVPHPLQILEQGRLIGSTDFERLMLPAGQHALEFVNDELGFRERRTVRVEPGATTTVAVELPRAPLAINAQPWASVWVDGEPVGETPIGNLTPTIGRHEVVFRHPELGERRASVLVTLKGPARIGVELRR